MNSRLTINGHTIIIDLAEHQDLSTLLPLLRRHTRRDRRKIVRLFYRRQYLQRMRNIQEQIRLVRQAYEDLSGRAVALADRIDASIRNCHTSISTQVLEQPTAPAPATPYPLPLYNQVSGKNTCLHIHHHAP